MIRRNCPVEVHLIRHSEAYKNLEKVHGGGDQRLTERGLLQAQSLATFLLRNTSFSSESSTIIHQPEGRTKATAKQIGDLTSAPLHLEERLKGVGMGVIGGLSERELEAQYPDVARSLSAWRGSSHTLSRPKVPGSEPMVDYAARVSCGLTDTLSLVEDMSAVAVIGTTSTLVMLNHLLLNDGKFVRPEYRFAEYPLGSLASWRIHDGPPVRLRSAMVPNQD